MNVQYGVSYAEVTALRVTWRADNTAVDSGARAPTDLGARAPTDLGARAPTEFGSGTHGRIAQACECEPGGPEGRGRPQAPGKPDPSGGPAASPESVADPSAALVRSYVNAVYLRVAFHAETSTGAQPATNPAAHPAQSQNGQPPKSVSAAPADPQRQRPANAVQQMVGAGSTGRVEQENHAAAPRRSGLPPVSAAAPQPRVTVDSVDAADYRKVRAYESSAAQEHSLRLELTTRDGDRVVLDFSQLTVRQETRSVRQEAQSVRQEARSVRQEAQSVRQEARFADGGDGQGLHLRAEAQRLVHLEVNGELSEQERADIQAVLDDVLGLARDFFGGSLQDAVSRLNDLDFDTATLLDLSLKMSMTRQVEVARGYAGGDGGVVELADLAERDDDVAEALDFLADGQRRLIEAAREVLAAADAVRMVGSVLTPLLEAPRAAAEAPLGEVIATSQPERAVQTRLNPA